MYWPWSNFLIVIFQDDISGDYKNLCFALIGESVPKAAKKEKKGESWWLCLDQSSAGPGITPRPPCLFISLYGKITYSMWSIRMKFYIGIFFFYFINDILLKNVMALSRDKFCSYKESMTLLLYRIIMPHSEFSQVLLHTK